MKVLIGHNGTRIANDTLGDLGLAGLPENVEVDIVCVSESELGFPSEGRNQAIARAEDAKNRLAERFYCPVVKAESRTGKPDNEILNRAKSFVPDLIVVGENTPTSNDQKRYLQNVSIKVLTEAGCSVRIARDRRCRNAASPPRVVIGFDGSPGGRLAVDAVLARTWPANTMVRLVVVTDTAVLSSIGRFSPQMTNPLVQAKIVSQWAHTLTEAPMKRLKDAGLDTTLWVESGCPKRVLVEVAASWDADSIFLGPHCLKNSAQQVLLGSVSVGVAACAPCSVEVVRTPSVN